MLLQQILDRSRTQTIFSKVAIHANPFVTFLEICETMEEKIEGNPELRLVRAERDLLYEKLRDIDLLIETSQGEEISTEDLVGKIRTIMTRGTKIQEGLID